MFTVKLYKDDGRYVRVFEVDSLSIIRGDGPGNQKWSEVTMHHKVGDDLRADIGTSPYAPAGGVWESAIIENAAGRTTEIIRPSI